MFGTFEREDEKVKFGLVKNVNTFNPSRITFMGWTSIIEDIRDAKNLNEALCFIFGPPNTKGER